MPAMPAIEPARIRRLSCRASRIPIYAAHERGTRRQRGRRLLRPAQGSCAASRVRRRCSRRCCRSSRSISPRRRPPICAALFDGVDEVRLEIGFGGGEHLIARSRAPSAHRLHRHRAVRQRHGQGAGRDRRAQAPQHPPASRRRDRPAGLAAGGSARARSICSIPIRGRSGGTGSAASCRTRALPRSRAMLRPGGEFRFASDIPGLRRLDAGAAAALAGFRLDRRAGRRLAQALAGLRRHALRGQGRSAKAACPAI